MKHPSVAMTGAADILLAPITPHTAIHQASQAMTGAEAIVQTLRDAGVDVWFTNPGTTELHFMSALDRTPGVRSVLGLFEGVVTGAADGYARMAGKPAATLLHLGPGFANGIANLHNARRAASPIVNVIGDHAAYHLPHDAPLTSDIESLASPVSGWLRRVTGAASAAADAAEAVDAARMPPGAVATLIVPADLAWAEVDGPVAVPGEPRQSPVSPDRVRASRNALTEPGPNLLLLGGSALGEEGLESAERIAAATGCDLLAQTSNARVERGLGRAAVERVPYAVDAAVARLASYRRVVLAGARDPVAFFAYPGKPSLLLPPEAATIVLGWPDEDVVGGLAWLADELDAPPVRRMADPPPLPDPPSGPLTRESIGAALARVLPENAIVADESITTGRQFFAATHMAPPHTWLQLTGGAIGLGLPMATGAAVACPDRKVLALQADGSAMYTLQALWTQAREGLDVTNLILANRSYAILKGEMAAAEGLSAGRRALDMMELDRPALDWVSLARGMGVEGERVMDSAALVTALERGLATPGPYLVEAVF
jgi:acetolactate synthase I/II/III large subunit